MVTTSPEAVAAFLHEVRAGPRALSTLSVWNALAPYVRRDTGDILCTQQTLANTAGVSIGDVQRAIARLVQIGVLIKERRGVYRVHPSVLWKGELTKREEVEAGTPALTLVAGGKATK